MKDPNHLWNDVYEYPDCLFRQRNFTSNILHSTQVFVSNASVLLVGPVTLATLSLDHLTHDVRATIMTHADRKGK